MKQNNNQKIIENNELVYTVVEYNWVPKICSWRINWFITTSSFNEDFNRYLYNIKLSTNFTNLWDEKWLLKNIPEEKVYLNKIELIEELLQKHKKQIKKAEDNLYQELALINFI